MPTENIKISRAEKSDLEEILKLQKRAFVSEAELYNNYNMQPLNQTMESIISDFDKYLFLKAHIDNKIVGSVKGIETGEYCWIGKLIVDPVYQNRGIGKKLMAEIESEFSETKKYLLCTGHKSEKNIHLYETIGYKIAEIFEEKKYSCFKFVKMIKDNNK